MYELDLGFLGASLPDLGGFYWFCLIVGGGLLLLSVLGGSDTEVDAGAGFEGDLDFDLDADFDVDADLDVDTEGVGQGDLAQAASLSQWFSIRFLIFFAATFGMVGVILTNSSVWANSEWGPVMVLGTALAAGIVVGQGVHRIVQRIRKNSGNSAPGLEDYLNQPGRVTVTVRHGSKGEVAIRVRGGGRYIPATSKRSDTVFKVGDMVAVVSYQGGVAEVISGEEFEFLNNQNQGGVE